MGSAQIEPRGLDDDATGVETLRVLLIDDDRDDQLLVKDLVEDGSAIICDVAPTFEEGYDTVLAGEHDAYLIGGKSRAGPPLQRPAPDV